MSPALNWLIDGSDGGLQHLLLMLVRISIVLTFAWIAHFAWRQANPQLRVLLWRTTAIGLFLVFTLSQLQYEWALPILPTASTTVEDLDPVEATGLEQRATRANATAVARQPENSSDLKTQQRQVIVAEQSSDTALAASPAVKADERPENPTPHGRMVERKDSTYLQLNSFQIVLVLWSVGVAVISLSWLVGVLRLVSLCHRASPVPLDIEEQARAIAAEYGYSGPIDVRHTSEIQMPCNVGAWMPRVLIPSQQCEPAERQQLQASLAHELAHCMRHDLRWNHALILLQTLLWFHPLAWRIRLAHTDASDELCDAMAARNLNDQDLYGRLLAALAIRVANRQPISVLAMARRSQVRLRIEAVGRNIARKPLNCWQAGSLIAGAFFLSLLMGTVSLSRAAAPESQLEKGEAEKSNAALFKPEAGQDENRKADASTETSVPIAVQCAEDGTPLHNSEIRFHGRIGDKRFDVRLTTDQQGRAELRFPASQQVQHLWMTAKKSGYVPVHYVWRSDVKSVQLQQRLDLKLPRGLRIKGRVENESGIPIPAAEVELSMPVTWPGLAYYVFTAAELKTDEEGRWEWDGAPEDTGSMSIRVKHPDYIRGATAASRGSGNIVVLKSGLEVRGRVVDRDGNPVEGATAQLGLDRFGTGEPQAKTNEQGVFVLKNCKPGPSAVTIQATGYSPEVKRIKIGQSTEAVDFQLGPAHVLRGRVVNRDGEPLSGVVVAPDTWKGFRTLENRMTTDAEGRFEWNGAPADGVQYSILKKGYMSRRDFVMTAEAEEQIVTLDPELQVSGSVTDASTGAPVEAFAVRHGFLFTNTNRNHWSRDEGVPYKNGEYSYKFDEPMHGHLLQVVAPGYLPKTSRVFKSHEGTVQFNFSLKRGQGPSGIIKTADGGPAIGAEVGLATREKRAFLDGGRFDRSQNQAEVVTTDENGRFSFLPQDADEFVLLVFHEAGFAEVTGEELASDGGIVLQPWGKLQGQVLLGDKPEVGREVSYSPKRPDGSLSHHFVWSYGYETKSDGNGRFEFDRVIPGPGTLSRVVVTAFLKTWQHSPCWQTPVEIQPHETTEATIGGTGRPVSGKVVLDRDPDVEVDWTSNEPATIVRWNSQTGRRGDPYARYAANINASGEFRIPDVPAGDYKLTVPVNNPPRPNACGAGSELGKAELVFTVPDITGSRSDDVHELGTVTAKLFDTLEPGELAPDFVAERLDGGTMRLSEYRGQLVVLDFWATWCGPCLAEMPTFQKLQEEFGGNSRFALISLSCDNTAESAKEYVEANSLSWHHAHVAGTQAKAPRDYTVRSLPATFLVAPDGTVLAKNLRGEDLIRAVQASVKDEDLFTTVADGRPARFPVVRFEVDKKAPDISGSGIAILDNIDPTFDKDKPHDDRLRIFNADGDELWSRGGLNNAGTVGGVHGAAVDRKRGRIYIRENVADRITAFNLAGQRLWQIDAVDTGCILVDEKTGNLWCSGGPNLKSGETVLFDAEGNEVAAFPYHAIDMAYDPKTDAFWLVGYEIIKLARDGEVLFRESVEGWCCPSVSVNPNDGSVWIAERDHPDVARSKNRLWCRDANGTVLRELDLGDSDVFVVACEPKSGVALFSGYKAGLKRVSLAGEPQEVSDYVAKSISVSPTGEIWIATEEAVLRIDEHGDVKVNVSFDANSKQSWIAAF